MPKHWKPISRKDGIIKVLNRKTGKVEWGFIIFVNGRSLQRSGFDTERDAKKFKYEEFMEKKYGYLVGSRAPENGNGNGHAYHVPPREPEAPGAATVTVEEAFEAYKRDRIAAGKKPKSAALCDAVRIYEYLAPILQEYKIVTLRDLAGYHKHLIDNRDAMQEYIEQRRLAGNSENTIKQHIRRIRTILNSLETTHPEVTDFKVPKFPKIEGTNGVREVWLTHEQLKDVLTAADPYLRDFLVVLYHTAIRSDKEMKRAFLRPAVDFTPRPYSPGGVVRFVGKTIGKTQKEDELLLSTTAAEILKRRYQVVAATGRPPERQHAFADPGYRMLAERFQAVCEKLGIKWGRKDGVTLHTLRHTTATHLGIAGFDDNVIRSITRHADPNAKGDTLNTVYKHKQASQIRAALEFLEKSTAYIDELSR